MGLFNRVKDELENKEEPKPEPPSEYRIYKRPEDDKVVIDFGGATWVVSKRMWAFLDHLVNRLMAPGFISHESLMMKIAQTIDDHGVKISFDSKDDGAE